MNPAKVSIIVLNWNGLEDTIECLESLKKIAYPNYEIIVVDNGSEGKDVEVLREKFADYIHMIENDKNYGFTGGNNIAIRWLLDNSKPDYFLLLNNDTIVDPEFLTEMVKVAEEDPSIGIAGPKTYLYDEPNRFWLVWFEMDMWKGKALHVGAEELDRGQYEDAREVDFIPGSCFLIKNEVIRNVGLLDESLFNYGDETDYCLRSRRAGYKIVYSPEAKIWHKVSRTARKIGGLPEYYITRNNFWIVRKYATRQQFYSCLLYFFFKDFWLRSAGFIIHHRDLTALLSFYKGIKDGLLGQL